MGWSWVQQPQPTLKECLLGKGVPTAGGVGAMAVGPGTPPPSPSHCTDMQIFIYKRGS